METSLRLHTLRHLLRRDLFMDRTQMLIGLAVMTGFVVLTGITEPALNANPPDPIDKHTGNYLFWFFLFGLVYTAGSFREFAQVGTLQDYLLLPASTLEKWAARWIKTLPLYILGFSAAYTLVALLLQLILFMSGNHDVPFFHPFQPEILDAWKGYLILHALFFVGAVQFNRMPIPKTLLTLAVAGFGFVLVTGLVLWAMVKGTPESHFQWEGGLQDISIEAIWMLNAALTLFLWFVSYLKLTEKEV